MVPELKQYLFHVERGRKGLDEHRRADGVVRHPNVGLRENEDIIPETRLHVVFHFWKVEVWPRSSFDELMRIVKEIKRKVKQRG